MQLPIPLKVLTPIVKQPMKLKELLFEAYRRMNMFNMPDNKQSLTDRWLGLGTKTTYLPALKSNLMVWTKGKEPLARCTGWLKLTENGVIEILKLEDEFRKQLDEMDPTHEYLRTKIYKENGKYYASKQKREKNERLKV
jgi:hypothetical protein